MYSSCDLCACNEWETVSELDRDGNPLRTMICMGCGIIANVPIPSRDDLFNFYSNEYRKSYKGAAAPRLRQVWRNFRRIEKHLKRNRAIYNGHRKCLDLGSGSGEFMFLVRAMGIDCIGIEPSVDYAAYSRDVLGLNVETHALEDTEFQEGSFDLIRLSHVLEHMPDPVRSLERLRRLLCDDGVLYIEVPNIEDEAYLKVKGRLFHYGHIFNFNPFTLRLASARAGLEELPVSREQYSNTTAAFFGKAGKPFVTLAGGRENARQLKAALDDHYKRLIPRPKEGTAFGRLIKNLWARMSEFVATLCFPSHRQIADYFRRRM